MQRILKSAIKDIFRVDIGENLTLIEKICQSIYFHNLSKTSHSVFLIHKAEYRVVLLIF